ncbi:hypothetical protein PanWU01x14_261180 [Parasponia andersonii]|uniref:Uncharacterized protein n=1 Tax=Parasponia andersonii TaxID=3476 RepID=A0A2P5B8P6_PARAD|nr:hypothetical protein PanWU01x14_261180 [Parasponia andersonii]
MRDLEQIQIFNWKYLKHFCNDILAMTAISGNYCNPDMGERIFSKLPGELGKEIHAAWKAQNVPTLFDNIGVRVQHIISKLKRKMHLHCHSKTVKESELWILFTDIYSAAVWEILFRLYRK